MGDNKTVTNESWENFVTLPDERILVAKREHWITLISPMALSFILTALFIAGAGVLFLVYPSPVIFIVVVSSVLLFSFHIIAKTLVEWAFHLYIITNRKLLELRHSPIASSAVDDVLLDQVRCTEVDTHTEGVLEQFLDVGNIDITFDRPTHQHEFMIRNVEHYQQVGALLRDALIAPRNQQTTDNIWFSGYPKGGKNARS